MKTPLQCVMYSRLRIATIHMKDFLALRFYTACNFFMKAHEWYDNVETAARAIESVAEVMHILS